MQKPSFCRRGKLKKRPSGRLLHFLAGRTLHSSNLLPLNELGTSGLQKAVSPHQLPGQPNQQLTEVLLRDVTAINDFLIGVEAEPFVTPEKAENRKRVAFKKVTAALEP